MDQPELFFESKPCDIYYIKPLEAVHSKWKGVFASNNEFHKIMDTMIDLLEAMKSNIIYADARNMKVISDLDQHWLTHDWYPRALKKGFRYQAILVAQNTFSEYGIRNITKTYDMDLVQTMICSKPEAAVEWINKIRDARSNVEIP
jgi:hypothetical protein